MMEGIKKFFSKFTFGNILRWVTFLTLSVLIGLLSYNLFTGLAEDKFHKTVLGVAAIAIEALKVIALISANTFLFLATVIREKNIRLFIDGTAKKLNTIADDKLFLELVRYKKFMQQAVLSFIFYGVCSITTVSSSLGFILEAVEQGRSLAVSTEVSIDDQINSVKDTIQGRKDTVTSNKEIIANNKEIITSKKAEISSLDKSSETYAKDKARLEREVKNLLDTNTKIANTNTDLLNQNTADLEKTQTKAVTVKAEKRAEKKDMYTLMGEATGLDADKIRMFLLFLMSLILEVGLFYTAPHMYKIEEEEKKEEAVREITEEETVVALNTGKRRGGRPKGSKNKPKAPVLHTSFEPSVETEEKSQEPTESELDALGEALVGDMAITLPVEEPVVTDETQGALEVAPSNVEGTKPSDSDRLISALWDNDGKKYLKDLHQASKEAGVPMITAQAVFQWLQNTKYDGYPMVEFRTTTEKWYPNVTSEIAKKLVKE